ncbi:hypothetical protein PAMA_012016 [Pampus argenteus]
MDSREEDTHSENITSTTTSTTAVNTTAATSSISATIMNPSEPSNTEEEETDELIKGNCVAMAVTDADSADEDVTEEDRKKETSAGDKSGANEDEESSTLTRDRLGPPGSLTLLGSQPVKKKVLVAPALSLSLGRSDSAISDDFPSAFLSPSLEDDDDTGLDFDLDAIETPSDSESLAFPVYDPDLEDDMWRLGMASGCQREFDSRSRSWSGSRTGSGLGALEQEDQVDSQGTRWRCFSTGDPLQESRVNMSVLEPFLRVLSHAGYYGDGMNDIIVFSSCYLPENSLENYQYIMDNLFRYVVGTLDLMVAENYVIVYLCVGGQKDKLPGISWLKECYTTIDRRLRKNLKGFYVVHPTWYIKALITIIKPFISSKFSRKLQFVDSLQGLSHFIPTEHVQIPDCVRQYDQRLSR